MTHELRTRQAWRRQFLERCQTLFCRTWKVSPVWVRHALSAVRRGDRVLGFPCAFTLFHALRECLKPLLGAGFRPVAGPRLCAQHRDGGNACRGTQGCPLGQPPGAKCLLQNTQCVPSGGDSRKREKSGHRVHVGSLERGHFCARASELLRAADQHRQSDFGEPRAREKPGLKRESAALPVQDRQARELTGVRQLGERTAS